jgi:hypothetical protein
MAPHRTLLLARDPKHRFLRNPFHLLVAAALGGLHKATELLAIDLQVVSLL